MSWLEKLMTQKGVTYSALKTEFHLSPDTIKSWASGKPARAFAVRKLANALGVEFQTLVRGIGLKLANEAKRTVAALKKRGVI